MNELISVIVPVYNVDKYLEKCLDSILNQTYETFELIIVNDGSTDNSGAICERYKKLDSRIIYYIKKNGGLSSARNYGIDRCNGEYICFIDSDDYIYPDYLKILYENAIKYKVDIAACTYNQISENKVVEKHFSDIRKSPRLISKEQFWNEYYFKQSKKTNGPAIVVCWNKLYSRRIFINFRYKDNFLEDEWAIHHLIHMCGVVVLIDNPLYFYNLGRIGSLTNCYDNKLNKRWSIATKAFIDRTHFFINNKYSVEIIKASACSWIGLFVTLTYKNKLLVLPRTDLIFLKLCSKKYISKHSAKLYLKNRFFILFKIYKLFKRLF